MGSSILITCLLDKVLILWGEVTSSSLLGVKGQKRKGLAIDKGGALFGFPLFPEVYCLPLKRNEIFKQMAKLLLTFRLKEEQRKKLN